MLVDPGFSKHFVDPKLIRGAKSKMKDYTEINPPMEIKLRVMTPSLVQHRVFYWL